MEIFRLKRLKSFQFTYRMKGNENVLQVDFDEDEPGSIEYLIINGPCQCEFFQNFVIYRLIFFLDRLILQWNFLQLN